MKIRLRNRLAAVWGGMTRHAHIEILALISLLLGVWYLGTSVSPYGLSFIDLAPWSNQSLQSWGIAYSSPWRSNSYQGNVIGLGSPNQLSILSLTEVLASSSGLPGPVLQFLSLLALLVCAAVGFWLFLRLYTSQIPAFLGSLLYAFNPFMLVALYGGGNPFGILWYAVLPFVLFFTTEYIRQRRTLFLGGLAIALAVLTLDGPEYVVLTILLCVIPTIFVLFVLNPRTRLLAVVKVSAIAVLAVILLSLIPYEQSFSQLGPASSTATGYGLSVASSFPSGRLLLFYIVPSFGALDPYSPALYYYNIATASALWIPIALAFDVLLVLPYLVLPRTPRWNEVALVPAALGVLFLGIDLLYASGGGGPLFGAVPELSILDTFYKIYPLMVVFTCSSIGLLLDWALAPRASVTERAESRSSAEAPGSRLRTWRLSPESSRALVLSAALGLVVLLPLSLFSPSTFASITNETIDHTAVPGYIAQDADQVDSDRQSLKIADGYDLWLPINGGTGIENAILSEDTAALFFPVVPRIGNPEYGDTLDSYLTMLGMVANGTGQEIGHLMAELNIAMIVVVTIDPPINSGFQSTFNPGFNGTPVVIFSGFSGIEGSYIPLLRYLDAQADLRVVSESPDGVVLENLDWRGPITTSSDVLVGHNIDSTTAFTLSTLPSWQGPTPVIIDGTVHQQSSLSAERPNSTVQINSGSLSSPHYSPGLLVLNSSALSRMNALPVASDNLSPSGEAVPIQTVARDSGPNDYPGLVIGNFSTVNTSLYFANHTYVQIPLSSSLAIQQQTSEDFSLSVWVNSAAIHSPEQTVFSQGGAYQITSSGSTIGLSLRTSQAVPPDFFYLSYKPDQWYLLTLARIGNTVSAYANATLLGTESVTGAPDFLNTPFLVGSSGFYEPLNPNLNWSGYITQLRIFNYSLTSSEISKMYSAGPYGNSSFTQAPALDFALYGEGLEQATVNLSRTTLQNSTSVALNGAGNLTIVTGSTSTKISLNPDSWAILNVSTLQNGSFEVSGDQSRLTAIVLSFGVSIPMVIHDLEVTSLGYSSSNPSTYSVEVSSSDGYLILSTTYASSWESSVGMHFDASGVNCFVLPSSFSGSIHLTYEDPSYLLVGALPFLLYPVGVALVISRRFDSLLRKVSTHLPRIS